MKKTALFAAVLAMSGTGCSALHKHAAEPIDNRVQVQYADGDWRICHGTQCRNPTKKTVMIADQQSVPPKIIPQGIPPMQTTSSLPSAAEQKTESMQIHFELGTAKPTPQGMQELELAFRKIKASKGPVSLTGFTDSHGSEALNIRLAKRRALFVSAWLRLHGIKNKIIINAKGRCCYVSDNDTEPERALNRRVEININQGETN